MFNHNHLEHALRHAGGVGILLLTLAGPASADNTVGSAVVVTTDDPDKYEASGPFRTNDGAPANGLDGSAKLLLMPINNWRFEIWHKVTSWTVTGALGLEACIEGKHLHGPHPPPAWVPSDIDPNTLDKVCKARGVPGVEATYGVPYFLVASNKVDHPTTGAPHKDTYTLEAGCTANPGAPPFVMGSAVVTAKHEGKSTYHSYRKGKGKKRSNSAVAFDKLTGQLHIMPGPIDVLDSDGGLSGGIEPMYLDDPILDSDLVVTSLHYLGLAEDGRHRFSGGQIVLFDQIGEFSMEGSFPEYLIGDTSRVEVLDSYGLMEQITALNATRQDAPGQPVSQFLYDFVHTNLMGEQMPVDEWMEIQGIDLAFVTPINLVELTQGFTQSASSPASVVICANRRWLYCAADLNGDGSVGISDFLGVLAGWGMPADGPPDLNGDDTVGIVDLLQLLASWGPCPNV